MRAWQPPKQSQGRTGGNFGSCLRAVAFDSEAIVLLHCHVAAIEFTAAVAAAVAAGITCNILWSSARHVLTGEED